MRVLHVIPSVSPRRGGPSFTVQAMAEGLAGTGIDVSIATTDDDGPGRLTVPLLQPLMQNDITYWYFPRQTGFYTASWPLTRWLQRHISDFDLVHIHALFSYAALPAALFAARRQIPYVIRPLGTLNRYGMQRRRPWLKRLSFALIERNILRHAATIHYTSEQEQHEAAEIGVSGPAIIIPNPVALPALPRAQGREQFFQQYPWLQGRTLILFLSRLDPKKGLDLLLPAFAQAREHYAQVALVIAGSGDNGFVEKLKSMAADLGIAADVIWTGFLESSHKAAALAAADMFVLPSYSENFGNVVIEAMSYGTPVIISDQVGIHREIASNSASLVVPCSSDALATAMAKLLDDRSMRYSIGQQGRKLVTSHFSNPAITSQLVDLYTDILRSRNHGVIV